MIRETFNKQYFLSKFKGDEELICSNQNYDGPIPANFGMWHSIEIIAREEATVKRIPNVNSGGNVISEVDPWSWLSSANGHEETVAEI